MTREETQNLLAMMQAAYQNYNPPSKTAAVNVWHMMLQDFDWKLVQAAFVAFCQRECQRISSISRPDHRKNPTAH